jgi:hypothetical protein
MDSFLGSSYAHIVGKLESDVNLLKKILYRNRNQHGNTLAFSYAKRITRALALQWRKDHLLILQQAVTEALRFRIGETKLSQEVVEKLALHGIVVAMTITSGTKALHNSIKGYHAYSELLRKQVFLPLFTVLWSLMARIFKSLKEILLPLHLAHQHINSCIQHVTLVSDRYALVFTTPMLTIMTLSEESINILDTISHSPNGTRSAAKLTMTESDIEDVDDIDEGLPVVSMGLISSLQSSYEEVEEADDVVDVDSDDDIPSPPLDNTSTDEKPSKQTKTFDDSSATKKKKLTDDKVKVNSTSLSEKMKTVSKKRESKDIATGLSKSTSANKLESKSEKSSSKKRKKDDIDDIFGML